MPNNQPINLSIENVFAENRCDKDIHHKIDNHVGSPE